MIKRHLTDIHSLIGMGGLFTTIGLQQVSAIIAVFVGIATLCYMTFRALREYGKWKNDKQKIRIKNED
jgi:Na+(H+)/acetate symporter ActP